ncbi:erythromycin esterase family protein [Spirillospora sp. CA-255316]
MPENIENDDRARLSGWIRENAAALDTLDPDAPLDDLEPLRDIIGDARVVALGEGCHFVREFTTARRRILRFLAERCGFTALAFEFGFAEAPALDRWLRGEGEEAGLAALGGTTSSGVTGELARWLRRYNAAGGHPLRFLGIDVPQAGGTLRPALEPVAGYLREVDPDAVPYVERALEISDRFAGGSVAVAAPRWAELDRADQDALSALLGRVVLRCRALEPAYVERGGRERYETALRRIEAAWHADYMVGALNGVFTGTGLPLDTSVRDRYMADSLLWQLERAAPDDRIVVAAHNNHIQKTPVRYDGELWAYVMGHYLAGALGGDYRVIAMTHTADSVPEMDPDGSGEVGFSIVETPMDPPGPGSVEGALIDAGLGSGITLTDLRGTPRAADGSALPGSIRSQSAEMVTPVPEAFDAVLTAPTATTHFTTAF